MPPSFPKIEPNFPRALSTIFLSYPSNYKGYKRLDIETNIVFISKDVVFHETIFPFKDGSHDLQQPSSTNATHISLPSFLPSLVDAA